jgi:class 3 adenylate cyclase/tetratricopeptide (TPR) repeat protein
VTVCAACGYEAAGSFRFCPDCGARAPSDRRELRKVVTVVFCDVVGSTSLGESVDPEALRELLARYFEAMRAIVERHGGIVEKFMGDAVVAVFGVPLVHEDDALRALRAAAEMRNAFPELGIEGRIGVNTGEVVTGTAERLVTGDPVNVAARLEQSAAAGEILVGEETVRLARDAVEVEPVEPLVLKGKAAPVKAYRLLSVRAHAERRLSGRMVGRARELAALRAAWGQAVVERACRLVTVLGEAGVGKSRLVAEFLGSLEAAVVLRGRCLPYGEGITYWPVAEVLKQLEPLRAGLALDGVASEVLDSLLHGEGPATSSEEIAWAFRKLLEAVASAQPVVCVFDDLQWGEETFLDLVEHVSLLSREAPIMLLCMARPEFAEQRPGWKGQLVLEPLRPTDVERLLERLLPDAGEAQRIRIREAAAGNPLFVEEMAAMAREAGEGEIAVPATIQALLAARLDQLHPAERRVLERAAVEGEVFHRGAVQALAPEEPRVTARLAALARKELVRPERAQLPGEDGFRFRHLLIRDAAYGALSKGTRAELHERFAGWLEQRAPDLVSADELLGYHLEQAHRHLAELGKSDDALRARAAGHLATAGRLSLAHDSRAAASLLERALSLLPSGSPDPRLELDRAQALSQLGLLAEAEAAATAVAEWAAAAGNRPAELHALIKRARIGSGTYPARNEELLALAREAIPLFEQAGDDGALAEAWLAVVWAEQGRGRHGANLEAVQRGFEHAERAGLEWVRTALLLTEMFTFQEGSVPVADALLRLDKYRAAGLRDPSIDGTRAILLARLGRFDEARALLAEVHSRTEDLGQMVGLAMGRGQGNFFVETLAGEHAAAERAARRGCEALEQMGERSLFSTLACQLGQSLCALGRYEEAERWAVRGAEAGASDDVATQMLSGQVLAKVAARRGDLEGAERLALEALALVEETDWVEERADALLDLAEVLAQAGKVVEAAGHVEGALALWEADGNLVMAERAQARLIDLGASADGVVSR